MKSLIRKRHSQKDSSPESNSKLEVDCESMTSHLAQHNSLNKRNSSVDIDSYFNNSFTINVRRDGKIKKIIRDPNHRVTSNCRASMWVCLMGDRQPITNDFDNFEVDGEELPSFVQDKWTTTYFLSDKGRRDVGRILLYMAYLYPSYSYSSLLYYLTTVVLHYLPPAKTAGVVQNMLKGHDLFKTGLSHSCSDRLLHVHKYYCNKLNKGFSLNGDWIACLFYVLPFAYIVRIVDCYSVEGIKVIIRFGVAVAHYVRKRSVHETSPVVWRQYFSRDCAEHVTLHKLFRKAFRLSISGDKVGRLMEYPTSEGSEQSSDQHLNLYYIEELAPVDSHILSGHELRVIWSWLPFRMLIKDPKLIFTTREHGFSLKTFYSKCAQWESVIVAYQVTTGEKFGFYSPVELNGNSVRYYGTGETFVFSVHPTLHKYPWVGIAKKGQTETNEEMFIAGDMGMLIVGGGGGEAIFIHEDLYEGRSEHCDTFENDPLVEGSDFECSIVEVIGLG